MDKTFEGDKNCLSSQDVCSILEACHKAGVAVLKFGALEVILGRAASTSDIDFSGWDLPADQISSSIPATAPVTEITAQNAKIEKDELVRQEVMTRDDQIAMAIIENPLLAEQMIHENGVIEDEQSGAKR